MVNATKDHDSRHDAVVEHRRGFGIGASGVVDDVSVTSEAAPGIQESDIVQRVPGVHVGKSAIFFRDKHCLPIGEASFMFTLCISKGTRICYLEKPLVEFAELLLSQQRLFYTFIGATKGR